MMKKIWAGILACIMLIGCIPTTVLADSDTVILNDETGIPDPVLYATVLEEGDRNGDGILTVVEAKNILDIYVRQGEVATLKGISLCEQVQILILNKISTCDLSPLEDMTSLNFLSIGEGNISDLSPLANLTNMTNLSIGLNNISDISVVANMPNLKRLWLYNNNISDISALANLSGLNSLNLSGNNVSDFSVIANFTDLEDLGIAENEISDISILSNLVKLKSLDIDGNEISDISVLANMPNLDYLYASENNISDISPLAGLTNLKTLFLSENQISDVSPLAGLNNLTTLALNSNRITDKSPLNGLTNLTYLNLDGNPCEEVPEIPTQDEMVRSFVERMYTIVLNRAADPNGLADWAAGLMEQRVDGAAVVNGFVNSAEFAARGLNDEDYIKVLYRAILGREPGADEVNLWIAALAQGQNRQDLLDGFVESAEFGALCEEYGILAIITQEDMVRNFASRMYTVALNREADESGLTYWVDKLLSGQADGAAIADGFINSPEFIARNLNDTDYIKTLYLTFLNREADVAGLNSWLDAFAQGYGRPDVLLAFIGTEEFGALCESYGISAILTQRDMVENFVKRMYTVALNREADANGLNDWVTGLMNGVIYGAQVADGFIGSAEFEARGLSNEEYVKTLYQTFFNRAASAEDVSGWVSAMTVYGQSRREVMIGFVNSTEFGTLCENYGIIRGELTN